MSRVEFSGKTKAAAFERAKGCCEGCGHVFADGERVDFDHIVPDGLRKNNTVENCQVLCSPCHLEKTRGDITTIAKAKRVAKKHEGLVTRKKHIVPGSRASKWKKPLHGPAVLRNSTEKEV